MMKIALVIALALTACGGPAPVTMDPDDVCQARYGAEGVDCFVTRSVDGVNLCGCCFDFVVVETPPCGNGKSACITSTPTCAEAGPAN